MVVGIGGIAFGGIFLASTIDEADRCQFENYRVSYESRCVANDIFLVFAVLSILLGTVLLICGSRVIGTSKSRTQAPER